MQTNTKKILLEWEDEVTKSLVEGFRQLFESSSQVLLEFADAAENNRVQRLFFDAQREFYLKEETIVGDFERSLRENLMTFAGGPKADTRPGADTLSLVDVEDYERSLALETIAKRTVDKQMNMLHGLAQRLSALLGGRPIPVDEVPANPLQVIRLFDPVSRKLDVEKEVRLVFYTLFDRYVMSRLGDLYSAFNQRLVDLGILPNLKFDYVRPPQSSGGAAAGGDEAAGDAPGMPGDDAAGAAAPLQRLRPSTPTSTETLSAISSLLMAKRQQQAAREVPLQTSAPILPTAANLGEAIIDDRVLQEAPNPFPMPSGQAGAKVITVDAELLVKVKGALERQRRIIKSLVGRDKLERQDEDIIDIVGMLFEAMLNEKLLPNSVKTLLSHLHTRYLKIAVQSDDFLENTKHPARVLFERMLDAGIRWVREDNLRAGIYPQLQSIVTKILRHETLEDQLFVDLIDELEDAEKRLEQQSNAAEERTLEAERGRARLDQAKTIVKQTIDDIGGDVEVAPAVVTFLTTTFADYLTLLLLRSDLDTESADWSNAYSVGEALVAAAVYAAKGQPLGQEMRDDLTTRLQGSVGSLIPHHDQNIRRVIASLEVAPEKTQPAATPRQEVAPAAAAADRGTKSAAADTAAAPGNAEDQKVADKLMREAGNWFVMQRPDSEEQAVKLLWVNPHTRNMLLVDQHGAKVALMPAVAMAAKIREGEVRPMEQETSSFVARSLRRIRRALEDSVNG
ncbi:MAG: DUF1631 family protein [Gammaproteobacteria bacterium]|nr:DUF1631 family protein [Gammaproteobacteria bacterium]